MRLLNVVVSAGLLLTLASCGDKSSSSKRTPAVDPLVTSADWKIIVEGRDFPKYTMVEIDDETILNECADKQTYYIDRESEPQSLSLRGYKVPRRSSVKINVTDMGDCSGTNESSFFSNDKAHYEMSKNGAHAEILIRL